MSQQLINRSPDLQRLRGEGYDVEAKAGYLLVKGVPYVTPGAAVAYGTLVCPLTLADDVTMKPATHMAYFAGEHPSHKDGTPLVNLVIGTQPLVQLAEGVTVQHTLSSKPFPLQNGYADYYEEVSTYVAIISSPAAALNPSATAKSFPVIEPTEEESVFCYVDTASSRAGIAAVSSKLALGKVAIVGLGGTGAYVLDLLAKTPIKQLHLFDGDVYSQHNAFRSPGAASGEVLGRKLQKVEYFAGVYGAMHRYIFPHDGYLDATNVEQLRGMDFVFLCLDRGEAKRLLVAKLEEFAVPFIDAGMGIYLEEEAMSLGGIVRVTTSTAEQRGHVHAKQRIPFGDGNGQNEYQQNIQIADLNALNASLAVIKWKKLCGFYLDFDREHHCAYTLDGNLIQNEDRA